MIIASKFLIFIVALLHLFFMILEMFLWQKPFGLKTFGTTKELAQSSATLAANQGLYNGFLSAGLFASLFFNNHEIAQVFQLYLLGCVIIAGIYGGLTVNKKIFFNQAMPAIIAFALLLLV